MPLKYHKKYSIIIFLFYHLTLFMKLYFRINKYFFNKINLIKYYFFFKIYKYLPDLKIINHNIKYINYK